jgi:hypothetical protein
MLPVDEIKADYLKQTAFGKVLEYGYGQGVSGLAMLANPNVVSVDSWEADPHFLPMNQTSRLTVTLAENNVEPVGEYDFVFIDHIPAQWPGNLSRATVARHWRSKGATVIVDDADLEPSLANEAERILGMWRML